MSDTPEFAGLPSALNGPAGVAARGWQRPGWAALHRGLGAQVVNETTRATAATATIVAVTRMSLAWRR